MKTEETLETSVLEDVSDKLLKAQQEIDELALQLALGKAEAKDKFEEIKKEFSRQVQSLKHIVEAAADTIPPGLKTKIEALEVQLALGKADTRDLFEDQKKKILQAMAILEQEIAKQWNKLNTPHYFAHEVEKFKLKLEILRLRFGLKKFEIKDEYRERMAEAKHQLEKLTSGATQLISRNKTKYSDFKDEVSLAFKHVRKAVESLI